MIRVFLAGEGRTELGGWASEPQFRAPEERGVLAALLAKAGVIADVVDAVRWKDIRKFKLGDHRTPEQRNVMGLALKVRERQRRDGAALVLVFVRDSDGDAERKQQIDTAIADERRAQPSERIVGGCAVEMIEDWLLALRAERRRSASAAKTQLDLDPQQMVDEIDGASVQAVTRAEATSPSLAAWLAEARSIATAP